MKTELASFQSRMSRYDRPDLAVGALILLADHEDPLGIGVGVRLEQHAVDDAEDGRVQADAEAQAENRHGGECLAAPEVAQSVADVLEEARVAYTAGAGSKLRI